MFSYLDTIPKIIVILTGAIAFVVGSWKVGDYLEIRPVVLKEHKITVAENLERAENVLELQRQLDISVSELQFNSLQMKKSNSGSLDFIETQHYCKLAEKLGYVGIVECN